MLERLVVLVILGLLVGIVAPRFFGQVGKSETKVASAQIRALEDALDQYRLDVGRYPSSEQGLAALMTQPTGEALEGALPQESGTQRSLGQSLSVQQPRPARRI